MTSFRWFQLLHEWFQVVEIFRSLNDESKQLHSRLITIRNEASLTLFSRSKILNNGYLYVKTRTKNSLKKLAKEDILLKK